MTWRAERLLFLKIFESIQPPRNRMAIAGKNNEKLTNAEQGREK